MFFKKSKHSNSNAIIFLKYVLLGFLIILLPVTLFLTAFSWYASLEIHKLNDPNLPSYPLFWKNCLIFGIIGLMSFLLYFLIFFLIKFILRKITYKWKKIIIISVIFKSTLLFLLFEILSVIFLDYYYSWQLVLVLFFWPLFYILLLIFLLIYYFEYSFKQQNIDFNKIDKNDKEKDVLFNLKNHSKTIF